MKTQPRTRMAWAMVVAALAAAAGHAAPRLGDGSAENPAIAGDPDTQPINNRQLANLVAMTQLFGYVRHFPPFQRGR